MIIKGSWDLIILLNWLNLNRNVSDVVVSEGYLRIDVRNEGS